ncbi:pro-resilin-like [Maniola jurtina]|uniref:pro-resilin-like n=1 Tax=Maniola jurtina TaxID=191418 RepID=UPI001E68EF53|nr:pro-resilin-like [Maniola jurtina]
MFIFISLLACVAAEPPVGDGYAAARSSHDHHTRANQRSLSQEYGAPAVGATSSYNNDARSQLAFDRAGSAASHEYAAPGFRSVSQEHGPPNTRSRSGSGYGLPTARSSVSQEYGLPNARSGLSQNYGAPKAKSGLSQEYGAPNTRSGSSQSYGAPSARAGLSQEYGLPNTRSSISEEYGLPSSRSLSQQFSPPNIRNAATDYSRSQDYSISSAHSSPGYGSPQLRSSQDYADVPSDSYGAPLQRSQGLSDYTPSEEYNLPSQKNFDQPPSQKYGQPSFRNTQSYSSSSQGAASGRFSKGSPSSRAFQSSFGLRSPSQSFGTLRSSSYSAPGARDIESYAPAAKSISATYLPSSRSASETYGAPDGRSLSTEYGAPDTRGLSTNAYASSFDAARSIPSSKHGAAAGRGAMPSARHGVPQQHDALSGEGYGYARNALDELLNQEPASYEFGYAVSDSSSGSDFGHAESRRDQRAEGSYFVVLPDGTKQTVDYEADEQGFKPRISVQPADSAPEHDDRAAGLTGSSGGPYYYLPPSPASRNAGYPQAPLPGASFPGAPQLLAARTLQRGALGQANSLSRSNAHEHAARGRSGVTGSEGYDDNSAFYGRNEVDAQSEPASYSFGYTVSDASEGAQFGHREERREESAQGEYHVVLPDGRTQTVSYEADERGFKPQVSYQDSEQLARSGGYDADTRSHHTSGRDDIRGY